MVFYNAKLFVARSSQLLLLLQNFLLLSHLPVMLCFFVHFTAKNLHTQANNLEVNRATAIGGIIFSQRTNEIKWDVAPHWG